MDVSEYGEDSIGRTFWGVILNRLYVFFCQFLMKFGNVFYLSVAEIVLDDFFENLVYFVLR